ncbi:MAG: glycosyltransferase family 4 protein [Candidatus Atribacteria bacterium]
MKVFVQDPWGIRGPGVYTYSLCDALHKKNMNLTLITNCYYEYDKLSNFKVNKIFFKYSENIKSSIIRKVVRSLEYCFTMLNLVNKYSKESPDIIHIQWLLRRYQFEYLWLKMLRYQLRKGNTKIILTAHNILPHINGCKHKNILEKVYSQFDGIIVHSEVMKSQMLKIFGVKAKVWSICVIPHGAEDKLFEKVDENILNAYRNKIKLLKSKDHNFLFAGVINENKGLDVLLKAWGEHINKYPNDKLYIIGKPTYNINNELEIIKKYHSSIISSLEYKSDEELLAYYLECDFVILPYKEASQSGVLLTALTLGKPVIATKVGALPEVVSEVQGGYIVAPNDALLLSNTINKASNISKEELIKWSSSIRKKTSEKYSWDDIANQTIDFYKK